MQEPCGLLAVDKPAGMTSHAVVAWARRAVGTRRIGHAGTLDPLASGLLPLLVGPATRLVTYLHGWPKVYVGVIRLGFETVTGDLEGVDPALLGARPVPLPPAPVLAAARARLLGEQLQVPPVYSAKKVGGTPAHRLARAGFAPVLAGVAVTVHALRLVPLAPGRLAFAARVSSGTYLRALARDLGRLLGTGACLDTLRRTGIGPLRVRGALVPAPDAPRGAALALLEPPDSIPLPLRTVRLDAAAVARFRGGRGVAGEGVPEGPVRALGPDGLEGVGVIGADGRLQPRVVLRGGAAPAGSAPDGAFVLEAVDGAERPC